MSLQNESIDLTKGKYYQLIGPCKVIIKLGEIQILGKKFKKSDSFIIKNGKALPIEVLQNSVIILSGNKDSIIELENTIGKDWLRLLEEILAIKKNKKQIKIVVIGKIDCGKTTLIIWLTNKLLESNPDAKIGIIDLDMGQGAISPPTTFGLGICNQQIINIESVQLKQMEFIGNISPKRHMLRCCTALLNLLKETSNLDFILIDTTGWVNDTASRMYKTAKLKIIEPDIIVNINESYNDNVELYTLLIPLRNTYKIFSIKKSPYIYSRNRIMRKNIRENSLSRYFNNSRLRTFNFEKIDLLYTHLRLGNSVDTKIIKYIEDYLGIKIIYSEISPECLLIVSNKKIILTKDDFYFLRSRFEVSEISIHTIEELTGQIVGLKRHENFLGLGIISNYDFNSKNIVILTPIDGKITSIEFGSLKLDKNFSEVSYIQF